MPGEDNVLGLPQVSRACLLVVDGLGWDLLRSHRAAAPFLAGLTETGCWLAAGFPSTTVTSLSSLGTGQAAGPARPARLSGPGARRLASC